MTKIYLKLVCTMFAAGLVTVSAQQDSVPVWMDTAAPVVDITPAERFQKEMFHVAFSADEIAIIRYGINSRKDLKVYRRPVTIAQEGEYTIYFYGEDDFGNRSALDSMQYTFDTRPPQFSIEPEPGRYQEDIVVRLIAKEPTAFYLHGDTSDLPGKRIGDTLLVDDSLSGYFSAVDKAGNRMWSEARTWVVDKRRLIVSTTPDSGIFNEFKQVRFSSNYPATIYYTFDPSAPRDWFKKYSEPVTLPYGLGLLRFYGRTGEGLESKISRSRFVVDTIAPKVRIDRKEGAQADEFILRTRETATIWYTTDGGIPTLESPEYDTAIIMPRRNRAQIKAKARDLAGNMSGLFEWEYKYDKIAPATSISPKPGTYTAPFQLELLANEPSTLYYTLTDRRVSTESPLYTGPLEIGKEGSSVIRFIAVDQAGNVSVERRAAYLLDTRPPQVRVRIDRDIRGNLYTIHLTPDEQATIYYETGTKTPTRSSRVYAEPITLRAGRQVGYRAVDKAGNSSEVRVMKDLKRPMVAASPGGGRYSRKVAVGFITNFPSEVFYRMPPDTLFRPFTDSIHLEEQGNATLEYFSRTADGMESPIHRNEYELDWTAPRVTVTLRKGIGDSVTVFFDATENASIYYTSDGSSPLFSTTTRSAGNRFLNSSSRISVVRNDQARLVFYARDAAGNESALSFLDLSRPHATPNVPAGHDIAYNRVLSIRFSTLGEQSQIYYARHGNLPTVDSNLYTEPITLAQSDTLIAFVIDESGYVGEPDTFIYNINLPPSPQFFINPDTVMSFAAATFDGSATVDQETQLAQLRFRWDFDGDGDYETDFANNPRAVYTFEKGGLYHPEVEVKDAGGETARRRKEVRVNELCPEGMVYVNDPQGNTYCIDRYEWPNAQGRRPLTHISWVEAKMYCLNAGKRLCSAREWQSACRGYSHTSYPYASKYQKDRCPTEGRKLYKSGSFPSCAEGFGLRDMIGNAWEWVDTKQGVYPLMVGGSYQSGKRAHCGFTSPGTVASQSNSIGFRCCK
ncbi:MAG: SUMF1/EgtB/PvdO family nonheme iron enzyme [Chitinivibrionales bacterium]|nr:SUMF1/EgtB/PvdO family nonheme iron enzyme [Chitinivibrionales bacterium]